MDKQADVVATFEETTPSVFCWELQDSGSMVELPRALTRKQGNMPMPTLNPLDSYEELKALEFSEHVELNGGTTRWHEEALVPDARSGLSPAQMVERKVQELLGRDYRGIFDSSTGRPGHLRTVAGS